MKKKILLSTLIVSLLFVGFMAIMPADEVQASSTARRGPLGDPMSNPAADGTGVQSQGFGQAGRQGADANGAGLALTPLSAEEAEGVIRAIEEEYTARALYESVIATFGDVVPFPEIAASEAMHASALIRQAEKYGVAVPAYSAIDFPAFGTIEEACQAGVNAEIADAALYDDLMSFTTHTDLLRVYTNLQSASLNKHLPEFELCN
jgi:hypothetical protein